jgi:hypothetical protein
MENFTLYKGEDYMFFEHNLRGEDVCVKFLVKGKEIYDYEGCCTPPKEAEEYMKAHGYYYTGEKV